MASPAPLDERLVESATAALEMYSIHLGRQLGLYGHLTEAVSAEELAGRAGIAPRYAHEWLEQQAVAGLVTVAEPAADGSGRRYLLDAEQAAVLLLADDPAHVSPLADMVAGIGGVLGSVARAYATGEGVPYADYGPVFRSGQGGINRPAFTHDLPTAWLDAVPDLRDRLRSGGRVADLGTGTGFSAIAMAAAFPDSTVIGYDSDPASIEDAAANAASAGVAVRFEAADASALAEQGPFDLILVLEVLHDLARPVEVLTAARKAMAEGGAVLVADEKVAESFSAPGDALERMMYGWSVVHCLPAAMADQPSRAIGTVIRQHVVEQLAVEAGFTTVEASGVDAGFFRLYVLR